MSSYNLFQGRFRSQFTFGYISSDDNDILFITIPSQETNYAYICSRTLQHSGCLGGEKDNLLIRWKIQFVYLSKSGCLPVRDLNIMYASLSHYVCTSKIKTKVVSSVSITQHHKYILTDIYGR